MTDLSATPINENILELIDARNIREVLHFTTRRGLLGILATGLLKSRALLSVDDYLEHIYTANAPDRSRDRDWWGYVSLSITTINKRFFRVSGRWHEPDMWWAVLAFDPVILSHEGVQFVTTNNAYSDCLVRGPGAEGLERVFADRVREFRDKTIIRPHDTLPAVPTCEQAEALYPDQIPTTFLKRIYFAEDEHRWLGEAIATTVRHPDVETVVSREVFGW